MTQRPRSSLGALLSGGTSALQKLPRSSPRSRSAPPSQPAQGSVPLTRGGGLPPASSAGLAPSGASAGQGSATVVSSGHVTMLEEGSGDDTAMAMSDTEGSLPPPPRTDDASSAFSQDIAELAVRLESVPSPSPLSAVYDDDAAAQVDTTAAEDEGEDGEAAAPEATLEELEQHTAHPASLGQVPYHTTTSSLLPPNIASPLTCA